MATIFGDYLKDIYAISNSRLHPERRQAALKRLEPYRAKTTGYLEEDQGSMGGYTTPVEAFDRILEVALENSIVRPRATVVKMESDTGSISRIQDTTHATTLLGGISISWTNEGSALSESNPAFGSIALRAKQATGLCYTSVEWLDDSIVPPEDLLIQAFGQAIAYELDEDYFQGDGVNQPLGILNSNAVISVSRAGTNLAWGDLVNMNKRLLCRGERDAIWVMNSDTQSRVYGTSPGNGFCSNDRILRKDYEFTDKLPHWGVTGDVLLAYLKTYLIADRDMIVMASDSYRFANDEIAWKFIYRGDGVPIVNSVLTTRYSSNTKSPYIVLSGGVSSSSSSESSCWYCGAVLG